MTGSLCSSQSCLSLLADSLSLPLTCRYLWLGPPPAVVRLAGLTSPLSAGGTNAIHSEFCIINIKTSFFFKEKNYIDIMLPTLSKSYCAPLSPPHLPPPCNWQAESGNKCTGSAVYRRLQTCKIYDLSVCEAEGEAAGQVFLSSSLPLLSTLC